MLGDLIFFRIDLDLQLLRWLDKKKHIPIPNGW